MCDKQITEEIYFAGGKRIILTPSAKALRGLTKKHFYMTKKPDLKNLPLSAYNLLDKLGMLYELYPDATGEHEADCPEPKASVKDKIQKLINGTQKV